MAMSANGIRLAEEQTLAAGPPAANCSSNDS